MRHVCTGAALTLLSAAAMVTATVGPAAAIPVPPIGGLGTTGALAWGANPSGELGDGTHALRISPVEPVGLGSGVMHVAAGWYHTLAVRDNGTVMAWGLNDSGQLGNGTTDETVVPMPVSALTGVIRVSAGNDHSLALRSDGTVWAWGSNAHGQLGDGTVTDRLTPVRVFGLTGVTDISAGVQFSLARRSDGSMRAWGANAVGQLGDGTFVDRSRPIAPVGLANVIQVSAGQGHSLALRADGQAFAWGSNALGALGDGTTVDHFIPAPVTLVGPVSRISAGFGSSLVVSGGKPVWWGDLCNGLVYPVDAPCNAEDEPSAHVVDIDQVIQVSAGGGYSFALRSDGTLWGWGWNYIGQLGDGTTVLRTRPVRILGATGTLHVDAGVWHTAVVVAHPPVNQG